MLIKRRSKVQEKNMPYKRALNFDQWKNIFRKLQANESFIMACLQIYRELFSLTTVLRVHSNSKGVSYKIRIPILVSDLCSETKGSRFESAC